MDELVVEITPEDYERARQIQKRMDVLADAVTDDIGRPLSPDWLPNTHYCVLFQAAHRADPSIQDVGIACLYRPDGRWVAEPKYLEGLADIVADFDHYQEQDLLKRLPFTAKFRFNVDDPEEWAQQGLV